MSIDKDRLPIRLTQAPIGGAIVQAADARDLHAYLEVGRDFTTWIKARVKEYSFEEGRDYVSEPRSPIPGSGNRGAGLNYLLTLDTAKELSMVERNDRGREARRYFIDCERRLPAQQSNMLPTPTDPSWLAWLALSTDERRTRQRDAILYGRAYGAPGMRYAMLQIGMPNPPRQLLGCQEQYELALAQQLVSLTVQVVGGVP